MFYRATVDSFGFRGHFLQAGRIVEVSEEEAKTIPHHFEKIADPDPKTKSELVTPIHDVVVPSRLVGSKFITQRK